MDFTQDPELRDAITSALTSREPIRRLVGRAIVSNAMSELNSFIETELETGTDEATIAFALAIMFSQTYTTLLFRVKLGHEHQAANATAHLFQDELLRAADFLVAFRQKKSETRHA